MKSSGAEAAALDGLQELRIVVCVCGMWRCVDMGGLWGVEVFRVWRDVEMRGFGRCVDMGGLWGVEVFRVWRDVEMRGYGRNDYGLWCVCVGCGDAWIWEVCGEWRCLGGSVAGTRQLRGSESVHRLQAFRMCTSSRAFAQPVSVRASIHTHVGPHLLGDDHVGVNILDGQLCGHALQAREDLGGVACCSGAAACGRRAATALTCLDWRTLRCVDALCGRFVWIKRTRHVRVHVCKMGDSIQTGDSITADSNSWWKI
eukprot:364050-Chlamydomonas_euryale.AAC.17